ncbi:MAG: hypothetical protein M2R45_05146 [Verrucomicrobia subdivision 3 bacterium]|nr:hypothetical protein [Limisphaerales bacterium]MCS1413788.1 hypothetical protein [Limisphaerales bacterium]
MSLHHHSDRDAKSGKEKSSSEAKREQHTFIVRPRARNRPFFVPCYKDCCRTSLADGTHQPSNTCLLEDMEVTEEEIDKTRSLIEQCKRWKKDHPS